MLRGIGGEAKDARVRAGVFTHLVDNAQALAEHGLVPALFERVAEVDLDKRSETECRRLARLLRHVVRELHARQDRGALDLVCDFYVASITVLFDNHSSPALIALKNVEAFPTVNCTEVIRQIAVYFGQTAEGATAAGMLHSFFAAISGDPWEDEKEHLTDWMYHLAPLLHAQHETDALREMAGFYAAHIRDYVSETAGNAAFSALSSWPSLAGLVEPARMIDAIEGLVGVTHNDDAVSDTMAFLSDWARQTEDLELRRKAERVADALLNSVEGKTKYSQRVRDRFWEDPEDDDEDDCDTVAE